MFDTKVRKAGNSSQEIRKYRSFCGFMKKGKSALVLVCFPFSCLLYLRSELVFKDQNRVIIPVYLLAFGISNHSDGRSTLLLQAVQGSSLLQLH